MVFKGDAKEKVVKSSNHDCAQEVPICVKIPNASGLENERQDQGAGEVLKKFFTLITIHFIVVRAENTDYDWNSSQQTRFHLPKGKPPGIFDA